jgi:hypothetical protein
LVRRTLEGDDQAIPLDYQAPLTFLPAIPGSNLRAAVLVLVLRKLGKKEAETLARQVEHRSSVNPLDGWETKLQDRPNKSVQWARTQAGWVPI